MVGVRAARDIMSENLIILSADLSASEAVDLLRENEISGAPVRDPEGKLVGVISLADLAGSGQGGVRLSPDRSSPDFFLRDWEEQLNPEDLHHLHIETEGASVSDLMTTALFTVEEETPLPEIARTMVTSHIHRVLVIRRGEVVGIVTSMDLLRTFFEET